MQNCLALGFGAVAARLAAGDRRFFVSGTQRSPAPCDPFFLRYESGQISTDLVGAMEAASALLVSIPPHEGEGALIDAVPKGTPIVYLSATSVYGDHQGGWVDERTPTAPKTATGKARLEAEKRWRGAGAIALRLGGIYGPGQSALDRLDTPPIDKPGHVFNRIHIDDVTGAIRLAFAKGKAGEVFNIVDDWPAGPVLVHQAACALVGQRPLPAEPLDARPRSYAFARFYAENKRVGNALAKARLGWRPLYRSFNEGLAAIAKEAGG
jgi:nucleoside-diphosphate-sugar epimerase